MKVKFNYKNQTNKKELVRSEYEVLAYGEFDDEHQIYLIANEHLAICEYDQRSIIVTDNNLESYADASHLNYGRKLLVKKSLLNYCKDFSNYADLKANHIWNKSKTAPKLLPLPISIGSQYWIGLFSQLFMSLQKMCAAMLR